MKRRILLYEDNDAKRYCKRDSKELFRVMEGLLTLAEAYVQVGCVKDFKKFFDNPLDYMIIAYKEVWGGNLLQDSMLRTDEVNGLKKRFDKLYSDLSDWDSQPIITATTMRTNIKPKNFKIYCKPEMEEQYKVLCNFIDATRMFEEHFPTQSRKQITRFTDNLLSKDLHPQYHLFAEFIDNR